MIYKLILLNKFVQVQLGIYDNFEEAAARMKKIVEDLQDKNYKSYIYIVAVNDTEYTDTDIISNIKRLNKDVREEIKKLW